MIGTKVLEETESKYSGKLTVVQTWGMGKYIQAGGLTQSGGIVETIWKSTINKVYRLKPIAKNITIFGLGGGTVAKLLRKKYLDSQIVGIEIDSKMVELGKKYLKLDEYDVDIKILDASKYKLKKNSQDIIVVDVYQGNIFPKVFESDDFIKSLKDSLKDDGLLIINRLYYGEKRPDTVRFGNKLEKIFDSVIWHYPEANLMFICKP